MPSKKSKGKDRPAKKTRKRFKPRDRVWRHLENLDASKISCGDYTKIVACTNSYESLRYNEIIEEWVTEGKDCTQASIGFDGDMWCINGSGQICRLIKQKLLTHAEKKRQKRLKRKRDAGDLDKESRRELEGLGEETKTWLAFPMPAAPVDMKKKGGLSDTGTEQAIGVCCADKWNVIWVSRKHGFVYKLRNDPDMVTEKNQHAVDPDRVWQRLAQVNRGGQLKSQPVDMSVNVAGSAVACVTIEGIIWTVDRGGTVWRLPAEKGAVWEPLNFGGAWHITAASGTRVFVTNNIGELWVYGQEGHEFYLVDGYLASDGSVAHLLQCDIGEDGTLVALTGDYQVVVDIPPVVRNAQKRIHRKRFRRFVDSRRAEEEEIAAQATRMERARKEQEIEEQRKLKEKAALYKYSDEESSDFSDEDFDYSPDMKSYQKKALLGELEEKKKKLDSRKLDKRIQSLKKLKLTGQPKGKCYRCGRGGTNDEMVHLANQKFNENRHYNFSWTMPPGEKSKISLARSRQYDNRRPPPKPKCEPPPFIPDDYDPQPQGLNQLIEYIDERSNFRRYTWHIISAVAWFTVCVGCVISSQEWDSCSTVQEPMAAISICLFAMTAMMNALRDRSMGKYARGGIYFTWYLEAGIVFASGIVILVFNVILTLEMLDQYDNECTSAWLLFNAFVVNAYSFLCAVGFSFTTFMVMYHRTHATAPNPSPQWMYEHYCSPASKSIIELTSNWIWAKMIAFHKHFKMMEEKHRYVNYDKFSEMLLGGMKFDSQSLCKLVFHYYAEEGGKDGKMYLEWSTFFKQHWGDDLAMPDDWSKVLGRLRGLIISDDEASKFVDLAQFQERWDMCYERDLEHQALSYLRDVNPVKDYDKMTPAEQVAADALSRYTHDKPLKWYQCFRVARIHGVPGLLRFARSRHRNQSIPTVFFPASNYSTKSPTILFCHGLRSDLGHFLPWLENLRDFMRYFNVASFEYPGFGLIHESLITLKGCQAALEATIQYLAVNYDVSTHEIILMGFGCGAGFAANYAAYVSQSLPQDQNFAGLVLLNAKVSNQLGLLGGETDWDQPCNFDDLVEIDCPVYLGHGIKGDDCIPEIHVDTIHRELLLRYDGVCVLDKWKNFGYRLQKVYKYPLLLEFLRDSLYQYCQPFELYEVYEPSPSLTPRPYGYDQIKEGLLNPLEEVDEEDDEEVPYVDADWHTGDEIAVTIYESKGETTNNSNDTPENDSFDDSYSPKKKSKKSQRKSRSRRRDRGRDRSRSRSRSGSRSRSRHRDRSRSKSRSRTRSRSRRASRRSRGRDRDYDDSDDHEDDYYDDAIDSGRKKKKKNKKKKKKSRK